jgi:hypothetical protein
MRSVLLTIDAVINIALGLLLLTFPAPVVAALGVPETESAFYPSILGAVLLGIGIALLLERFPPRVRGLGLGGAICINLCGAVALAGWLLCGELSLPARGWIVLWSIVVLVGGIGVVELVSISKSGRRDGR